MLHFCYSLFKLLYLQVVFVLLIRFFGGSIGDDNEQQCGNRSQETFCNTIETDTRFVMR